MDKMMTTPKPQAPRGMKIVLGVSLAINLAIAGAVLGAVVLHRSPDGEGPRERINAMRSLGPLAGELNRDEMRMLIGRMGGREGMGAARRGIGAANLQVEAALRATPFVPDALMQALSEQRGYLGAIQESGHRALVDLIADMPPERRAALADELAEGRRR